jgi:hypothetical protein
MYSKAMRTIICTLSLTFGGFSSAATCQEITGSATVKLSAPATADQTAAVTQAALDSLRNTLYLWVQENIGGTPNISNSVEKGFFNIFAKFCATRAKETSIVEDHDLTASFTLTSDQVKNAVKEHNSRYDALAISQWQQTTDYLARKRQVDAFTSAIKTLYNAKAHLGEPLPTPGVSKTPEPLFVSAQKTAQTLLNKLTITFSEPLITGKPSAPIMNQVTILAVIDSQPLAGLPLICQLPNGKEILSVTTDAKGLASLAHLKMPFVAYGTFLNIRPDLASIVDLSLKNIPAADFGLTLTENQDQSLIFNLVKPLYTLEYTITPVNNIAIPVEFKEPTKFKQFLSDSLHLQPANGSAADIAIQIECQVTSYTSDETEQTKLKTEIRASVRQLSPDGTHVEEAKTLSEKEYAHSNQVSTKVFVKKKVASDENKIPTGEYFWLTSKALQTLIRDMLNIL